MRKFLSLMAMTAIGAFMPAQAVEWTITYPAGGSANEIDDVQIKCTDVAYRYLADDATASLFNSDDNLIRTLVRDDITLNFKGNYCTVDFEFNPALTTPGEYTLSVPDEAFSTTGGDKSEAFSIHFSVTAKEYEAVEANFTCVDPANGKGTSLEYILLSSPYTWDVVNSSASGAIYNASFEVVAEITNDNLFPYNGMLMVALNSAITTPGLYMLIINESSLVSTASNATNAMAMVELTVEAQEQEYEYSVIPADNSIVSTDPGISSIYIAVDGYAYAAPNTDGIAATITKDGEAFATVEASALSVTMDKTTACIILPAEAQLNKAGDYVVTLPQGFFVMNKVGENTEVLYNSPEIVLHYTISQPAESLTWTIDPAPGVVDKIEKVKITFNKPVKAALTNYAYLFYTDYSFLPETVTEGIISVSDDGLTVDIDFNPVFNDGGIFQVRLYEGSEQLSVVDGETFPGISITYKVEAPLYTECVPSNDSAVDALQEVKVKLPRNTKIAATDDFSAWYQKGDTKVTANLTKLMPYDFGDPSYIVVTSEEPITEAGQWTLVIAEGSLTISNYGETMASPETSITFTIDDSSSILGIDSDLNEAMEIYSLQGVRLLQSTSKSDINSLAPGFYIVNGKKVRVK